MTRIGESPRRPDALGKAIGTALYAADVPIPGVFHGMTIRSPHAHAKILAIHWRPEAAPPDSVFVSAEDIRGRNGIQILDDSWPVLAREEVRHVGEPVALVAAMTRSAALEAARAVEVEYEPLTAVADMEDAEDVPLLHEIRLGTDGVEAALSRADRIITGEYRTGLQEHAYIENQAVTAWFETDGTLQITGSMQCPFYVHSALVHSLGLPEEMVRVRPTVVGGGFGGKEEYPSMLALHAALLATACGEPVRIAYDRHEDIVGTTKRHPSRVLHRTGVDAEGHIVATDIRVDLDGGAYRTLSPVVLSRAVLHAAGAYRAGVARIHGRVLRTNMPPSGAFRGFGAPQVLFAMERQMDRIARETGMNPVDIRRKNALRPGDALPTGQVLDDTTAAVECLEEAVRRTDFERKHAIAEAARHGEAEAPSKGIGVSLFLHGAGFTGEGERRMRSPVTVRLDGQGRIELLVANTEMGQGCATVLPQIAADSAGVAMEDIVLAEVDTATVPDSGPTVASRTTMVVGGVVARAAGRLAREVLAWWKERTGGEAPALHDGLITDGARDPVPFREAARLRREEVGPLEITMRYEPPDWQDFDETSYRGAAYPTYAWGANVVEVEVDPDTLEVRVDKATAVCEIGRAIHPELCRGQIEGGTLQAIGFGLLEELKTEDGRILNDRLQTYMVPTSVDAPDLAIHLLEKPWEGGPSGAKGIGELPMDGGAPAALQAVENATGLIADEAPATPEVLLELQANRRADAP